MLSWEADFLRKTVEILSRFVPPLFARRMLPSGTVIYKKPCKNAYLLRNKSGILTTEQQGFRFNS